MKSMLFSSLFYVLSLFSFLTSDLQKSVQKAVDSSDYYSQILENVDSSPYLVKAQLFFERSYEENLKNSNYSDANYNLLRLAYTKFKIGDFNSSEQLLVKALRLADRHNYEGSVEHKRYIYSHLGKLYRNLNNYDQSLVYFDLRLELANDTEDSIRSFISIGNTLRDQGKIKESINTLNQAVKLCQNENHQYLKGYVLDNLGNCELLLGDENGLTNLNNSIAIRKKFNDTTGLFSNYRHLSQYYYEVGNFNAARSYAEQALTLSKSISDPTFELEALGLMAQTETTDYVNRFKHLTDSLKEADLAKQNKYASLKYDVAQEQRQTKQARDERDRQKRLNTIYVLIFALAAILVLGTSLFFHFRRKQAQLEAIRKTEASISKKVHDGLANDTFQVISELQNLGKVPDHILNKLDKIYLETRDISKNHSPLIDGTNFKDQLVSRLNSYKSEKFNVITRNLNGINWEKLSLNKKDAIYMVLGELMTNTKKHSKASLVLISFEEKNKKLNIIFKDNGTGNPIKKGNGIQNMEFRIFSLNGTISFEPELDKGLKVQILV